MKYLKVLAIAVVAMFAFEGAKAQVVVHARIGSAPVYHPRTVVVNRPVYHPRPAYRRTVVVNRPVYRNNYRRAVVRPVYYRHPAKRVIVRHY